MPQKRLFMSAFFLFLAFIFNGCSQKIQLVNDGASAYRIYIADDAMPVEKHAARELQKTLFEMSGCKLPMTSAKYPKEKTIYIGFGGAPTPFISDLNVAEFGDEEYIIRTKGDDLLIAGGQPRGTLYGVIGFLSDYLGCRWYTQEAVKIPHKKSIAISAIADRQKPAFEYREAWYREAYNADWAVHNRLNPSMVPIPDSLGGSYKIYPFVHTFYRLVPPEKYFKTHPEYFSMIKGKRQGHDAQLCLTNPDVVKIATQTVFRWIKEHPDANVFSIDQNDGYGWCECPVCSALDKAEGSHSATVLKFVNQIADAVAKVYPKVKLQTLAYAYTEIPPRTIRPRANVTIRMCHYEYCCAHWMEGCERHLPFIERLNAWQKIAPRITIWDYFTDYNHYLLPFPNFESVKNHPRFYADHGCIGLFAQGSNVPDNGGGEFSALRAWVFAQLMWNPYRDGQALIDEFVTNVYGNAASYISRYIELLHDKVKPDSVYFSIFSSPTEGGYLTPELVNKAENLFSQAEKTAANEPALLKRVELAHLPILYTRLYFYSSGGRAFLSKKEMPAVLSKFQRIISEHRITRMAENAERGSIQNFIARVKSSNSFKKDWWLIGPFANTDEKGLQIIYPPEQEFDPAKTYLGAQNKPVKWQQYKNELSGYVDFTKIFHPSELGVAYARGSINMAKAGNVKIGVGSNDGVRLWINGKLVLDHKIARKAVPNQDIITVPLNKGENIVLLKIDQLGGGWGFYFSMMK